MIGITFLIKNIYSSELSGKCTTPLVNVAKKRAIRSVGEKAKEKCWLLNVAEMQLYLHMRLRNYNVR
jgi:hypothetical protein